MVDASTDPKHEGVGGVLLVQVFRHGEPALCDAETDSCLRSQHAANENLRLQNLLRRRGLYAELIGGLDW